MTNLLFGIILSAVFSITSLLVVLFRVSPLTSPQYALPAFFLSAFLCISTVSTLIFWGLWKTLPIHAWDTGKLLSVSLRQGLFIGAIICLLILFHLLAILNWWVAVMIISVFLLVELALNY